MALSCDSGTISPVLSYDTVKTKVLYSELRTLLGQALVDHRISASKSAYLTCTYSTVFRHYDKCNTEFGSVT